MIPIYMLVMTGQGDTDVKLVSKEIFEWVQRNDTPGRIGNESSWVDTAAPEEVRLALAEDDAEADVTSGSYQNDRALLIPDAACVFAYYGDTEGIADAESYAKSHGYEIVDRWEGGIY